MIFHMSDLSCDGNKILTDVTANWIQSAKQLKLQFTLPKGDIVSEDTSTYLVITNISRLRVSDLLSNPSASICVSGIVMTSRQAFAATVTVSIDKTVTVNLNMSGKRQVFSFSDGSPLNESNAISLIRSIITTKGSKVIQNKANQEGGHQNV